MTGLFFSLFILLGAPEHDLLQLVSIRSHHSEKAGLDQIAEILGSKLKARGFSVVWDFKTRSFMAERKPAVPSFTALFVGHMDTFYDPDTPSVTPQILKSSELFPDGLALRGAGALDAKAGIIQILNIIEKIDADPSNANLHLKIFIQADEEIFSIYSKKNLLRFAEGSNLALVFEPNWYDFKNGEMNMPVEVGGNLKVEIEISRSTSHAGISKSLGEGPNDILFDIGTELRKLRTEGISVSFPNDRRLLAESTPSKSHLKINFRYSFLRERGLIFDYLHDIEKLFSSADSQIKIKIFDIWTPHSLKVSDSLFEIFRNSAISLGFPEPNARLTRTHDAASFISTLGIPVLTSMAPAGESPHNENEIVYLGDFDKRVQLACDVILKTLSVKR